MAGWPNGETALSPHGPSATHVTARVTADCPSCGAPVLIVDLTPEESPGRVVLDRHEASHGAGRYAIWDDGTCRPVAAAAEVLAYPLHQCRPPLPR